MKYLVLAAVLALIYVMWKRQRAQERADRRDDPRPPGGNPAADGGQPQSMVRCSVCDLHLPRADAITDPQGRLFCSVAHRDEANA